MKLRIKGNSIRFRLTKSEVENFSAKGIVEECVHFSHQNFSYALEKSSQQNLFTSFVSGKLTVFIPQDIANQWVDTEQVSLEGTDGEVQILIEKDFACLKPRAGEDESDNFPHPKQDQSC